jgi:hypothetical protein
MLAYADGCLARLSARKHAPAEDEDDKRKGRERGRRVRNAAVFHGIGARAAPLADERFVEFGFEGCGYLCTAT